MVYIGIDTVKVTFDANGGTGSMSDIKAVRGSEVILPPCSFTPPEGYKFSKWKVGGTEYDPVEGSITVTEDTTVTAVWAEKEPDDRSVTLTADPEEGGTVSASAYAAEEGKTVDIFAEPAQGYRFAGWTITSGAEDGLKTKASIDDASSELAVLTAGSADVEVKAAFEAIHLTGIRLSRGRLSVQEGKKAESPDVIFYPEDALDRSVTWSVDDESVAAVDSSTGQISGIKEGNAVLTVTANDGGFTASCTLTVTHVHAATKTEKKAATCEEDGITQDYWVCDQGSNPCGKAFSDEACTQELTEEDLAGLVEPAGHKWGDTVYELSDDKKTVTASRTCEKDAAHVQEETADVTAYTVEPDCTSEGKTIYTAEFDNEAFAWEETEAIDALGHDWSDWEVVTEPTEKEEGLKERKCSRCDASEKETIPKIEPEPAPTPAPAPGSDPNQKGTDGTAVGPGASAASADKAITGMTSDKDPAGSVFSKLTVRSTKQTKAAITLKWKKLSAAKKYVIYAKKCGNGKPKKLAAVTGTSKTFKKVAGKKLKKGAYYMFIVVALDKNNNVVSTSKVVHVATKGGKVCNNKSVTVKKAAVKKAKSLKKGKSLKLNAKAVKQSKKLKVKKHVALRYESTNKKIAAVSAKGVIKAKARGTCYVYAIAQNGVYKRIKVTVK